MAKTLNIDELNINQRSEPYDKYFGIMRLSKRQIRERILFAEDFEDIFFEFLMYMVVLNEYGKAFTPAQEQLQERYRDKMFEYLPESDGDFIRDYAATFAVNAVDVTARHIKNLSFGSLASEARKIRDRVVAESGEILSSEQTIEQLEIDENQPETNWYVSLDRAKFNAENEANTALNRSDYLNAKEAGYSRKRWLTMADEKVRGTHREVNGITIPIDGIFVVGDSLFDYPKSLRYNPNPNEYINCRCSVQYIK